MQKKQGLRQGLKQGIKEGIEQGRLEEREKEEAERLNVAHKLLLGGMKKEDVSDALGLDIGIMSSING